MAKKAAKKIAKVAEPVLPPVETPIAPPANEPGITITQDNAHEVLADAREKVDSAFQVTVCDKRGNPHRTYTLEIHGSRFRELAEMFISDRPGWFLRE